MTGGKFENGAFSAGLAYVLSATNAGGELTTEDVIGMSDEEFFQLFGAPDFGPPSSWMAFHPPALPQGFVDAVAGWGDFVSFGATGLARSYFKFGTVNTDSAYYYTGMAIGAVNTGALGWSAGLNGGARSVFWSGVGNMERAAAMGVSLERTVLGSVANGRTSSGLFWKAASATYAGNVRGTALKVGIAEGNIWRTIEQPILNWRGIPYRIVP